jgi:hypothetical protein
LVVADAIRLIYNGPVTSIENKSIPQEFSLFQNYPNPFNPTTTIKFSIPGNKRAENIQSVQLKVFDLLGKEVETLVNENKTPGEYQVIFDASKLASGTYIYTLRIGNNLLSKKMLLLK